MMYRHLITVYSERLHNLQSHIKGPIGFNNQHQKYVLELVSSTSRFLSMNFLPAHSGIKLDLGEDGKCYTPFCRAMKSTYVFPIYRANKR